MAYSNRSPVYILDMNSQILEMELSFSAKVMKICRKYLNHLQNSVFEGNITEAKLNRLKNEIKSAIDVRTDSVCVFRLDSTKYISKEQIGIVPLYEHII